MISLPRDSLMWRRPFWRRWPDPGHHRLVLRAEHGSLGISRCALRRWCDCPLQWPGAVALEPRTAAIPLRPTWVEWCSGTLHPLRPLRSPCRRLRSTGPSWRMGTTWWWRPIHCSAPKMPCNICNSNNSTCTCSNTIRREPPITTTTTATSCPTTCTRICTTTARFPLDHRRRTSSWRGIRRCLLYSKWNYFNIVFGDFFECNNKLCYEKGKIKTRTT